MSVSALNHSPPTGYVQGCNPEYVVSSNRYVIFEDFGPYTATLTTPPTFVLFSAWPVAIGTVSLFYCGEYSCFTSVVSYRGSLVIVMAISAFYKRRRNHMQLVSNPNRGLYLRLMAISATEMLATIPLGTFYIVLNARSGVVPWKGWAYMHRHYSKIIQVAGFTWKNDPVMAIGLEMFRWSLVLCAILFFALFGFAGEAREHYYRLYMSLARRIGKLGPTPHAYVVRLKCCCPDSSRLMLFLSFTVPHRFLM